MAPVQVFQCPACGGNLSYDGGPETTLTCQYCGTTVIVPAALRRAAGPAPSGSAPAPYPGTPAPEVVGPVPEAQLAELKRLAEAGQIMQAIRLYRQTFDTSLTEARAAVEKMAAGESLTVTSTPVDVRSAQADAADLIAEAAKLARAGKTVEALQLVRQLHPDMAPDVARDVVASLAAWR